LSRPSFVPVRRVVAMICVALAMMLSGQTYVSLMDDIEHTHHHVHFANPLAGDLQFCTSQDACGHDHYSNGKQDQPYHHNGTRDAADHQHGGPALLFLAAQNFALTDCAMTHSRCESLAARFASISPRGPDRPPKPSLEIRV